MPERKTLVTIVCFNTERELKSVLEKFDTSGQEYEVLIVNDGSTDRTKEIINQFNFRVIEHQINRGVGAAIKTGIDYAIKNNYDNFIIMAGNGKDNPMEIPRLLNAINAEGYDYVQGSRFSTGGSSDNLPPFRFIMVKVHALLFSLLTLKRCTDALNGFRGYRLESFSNPKLNIWQDWLDRYELEMYLHYKFLTNRFKFKEVPVSKTYPQNWKKVKYSHIRPFVDWWSIMRPLFLLTLRIKK